MVEHQLVKLMSSSRCEFSPLYRLIHPTLCSIFPVIKPYLNAISCFLFNLNYYMQLNLVFTKQYTNNKVC